MENNIRKWRKKRNVTLDEMGKWLGTTTSSVWYMERKKKRRPSLERLEQIAEMLDVPVEKLWKS